MKFVTFITLALLSFSANAHNSSEATHYLTDPMHLMTLLGALSVGVIACSIAIKTGFKSKNKRG